MSYTNFKVTETIDTNELTKQIKYNGYSRADIITHRLSETNCYEYVAGIQKIIDYTQIKVTQEQVKQIINELFICPICREVFTDIVQLKSCLHAYCRKCFENCVRTYNKKCVCCRNPIETKRAAFSNPDLNELISLFIPNKEQLKFNEEEEYQLNKNKYTFNSSASAKKKELNEGNSALIDNEEKTTTIISNKEISLTPTKSNCLGHKRELTPNKKEINDDADNYDIITARLGLPSMRNRQKEGSVLNNKKPKYDIVQCRTPMYKVVNEFNSGDYAIIHIIPYKNTPDELNPFKTVKLVMHKRTSLYEIAIYISHQLKYTVLPTNMYFIIKENNQNRTRANMQMTISDIMECYNQTNTIDIYYSYNE